MMKIDVAAPAFALGESRAFAFTASPVSLDMGADAPQFRGDICVAGTVMNTGRTFRVVGHITASKEFVCDRCLTKGVRDIAHDFSEDYAKTTGEADGENVVEGDEIVIDDLVRDTLLVAEPLRELCKSDCKGLCPVCGQNLNEGACGCNTFVPDPRLAALESLLKND